MGFRLRRDYGLGSFWFRGGLLAAGNELRGGCLRARFIGGMM